MVSSQSRECIVSSTNELRAAVSIIDMNNQNNHNNERSFDFEDEPNMIKLEMGEHKIHRINPRGKLQPISESTLNMFAVMVAAGIGTLAVIGLVITVFVLALK